MALLEFYGQWCLGQYAGMSNALDLVAVYVALRMARVPRREWEPMTERLKYLHGIIEDAKEK